MVSNLAASTVTWFDESDNYVTTANITDDISGIPIFTDTMSGEVNEAEITLSAKDGKYINSGNVIEEFDRLRFQFTDNDSNDYERFYEVLEIIPSQTKSEGSLVTLKLLGTEYHTQMVPYSGQSFFTNPFRVGRLIGEQYEDLPNRGSRQPSLQRYDEAYSLANAYGNGFPRFTNNHYEFGLAEDTCYNRWLDIADSLGGTVETGGIQNFFEVAFDTPSVSIIDIALFESGARTIDGNDPAEDPNLVTITNTDSINLSEQEGGILNRTGTVILAWGSPVHGTLPLDFSKYRAGELEFTFRPDWVTATPYLVDARVIESGKHYKCLIAHTSGTFATDLGAGNWEQIDMSDEFGDSIQYSPWTDDKATLWANGGSAPDLQTAIPAWATATLYTMGDIVTNGGAEYVATTRHTSDAVDIANDISDGKLELVDNGVKGNGAGFFDSNRVINDQTFYRTWVNEIVGDLDYNGVNDTTVNAEYIHGNSEWPIGHRLLNVSDTTLSGNDLFGRSFTDAVVERVADRGSQTTTQWKVICNPDSTTDRMQVVVKQEGTTWEWNNSASEWQDITSEEFGNDCFHQYKSLYNIQGSDPRPAETDFNKYPEITKSPGNEFTTNLRPAVEVAYEFPDIISAAITADSYKKGAWINFAFPFPLNTFNSISEGVGDIFGGGTNEPTAGPTEPSFLDTQNMTYTPTGLQGFNQVDSENLGPLSSLSFMMRCAIEDVLGNSLGGVLNIRCTLCDRKNNLVIQDFELKFSDGLSWETIDLPIGSFGNYRARTPKSFFLRGLSAVGFEVPLNDLDVQNVFEWRHIKDISFQIQDFYDDDGRYAPEHNVLDFSNTGFTTLGGGTIRLAIDAFHFKKVLLASSGADTTRALTPAFLQRPNIISFNQLRNDAKSQLEIEKRQHTEYNFQTSGNSMFDIRVGDSFFLQNEDIVSETDDTDTGPPDQTSLKKIKLVAKRIEYHITKPVAGPGGVTRTIKGVKRKV